jgi:hypothetical protein
LGQPSFTRTINGKNTPLTYALRKSTVSVPS